MGENPPSDLLFVNGLDAASGSYLLPPLTVTQLSALAQGQTFDPSELDELKQRKFMQTNASHGVEGDQRDLAEVGWGILFDCNASPAVIDALKPLRDLRSEQAGDLYKEFKGETGYQPGQSKDEFLGMFGMGPGPVTPSKVPYYLLIVGDPEAIPFQIQEQLDVQYAVGRIHFDTPEEYAYYAESVVAAEKGLGLKPNAAFFGVANPDDKATQMSTQYMIEPLSQWLGTEQPKWQAASQKMRANNGMGGTAPTWQVQPVLRDAATRQQLSDLLNGKDAPALLFTASHGIGFPNGDSRQLKHQGALVCQDWAGPMEWPRGKPITEELYFAGDHLNSDANLLGMLAFFFACYGAGTPKQDEFAYQVTAQKSIAPRDFVAGLPRRMLSLPKGGALAVVGHIERAWGSSFYWGQAGAQLQVFQDCFTRLIKGGYPIGYALEVFNNRYAELSTDLTSELDKNKRFNKTPNDQLLATLWSANNDARNYIIIGDPAARLMINDGTAAARSRDEIVLASPQPGQTVEVTAAVVTAPPAVAASVAVTVTQGSNLANGSPELANYGLFDNPKETLSGLGASLQQFVGNLGTFLGQALDNATSLEVATYVSDNMSEVKYQNGEFSGAKLRALVRINIDGDTKICVPGDDDGGVNMELWKIHMDMVQQAQASRAELLKAAVNAASQLVNVIKPG